MFPSRLPSRGAFLIPWQIPAEGFAPSLFMPEDTMTEETFIKISDEIFRQAWLWAAMQDLETSEHICGEEGENLTIIFARNEMIIEASIEADPDSRSFKTSYTFLKDGKEEGIIIPGNRHAVSVSFGDPEMDAASCWDRLRGEISLVKDITGILAG